MAEAKAKGGYDFDGFKKDALTKPRDLAWENWAKFEKVGDKYQGYIRDVFFRAGEGDFSAQRGITLEQADGTLVNVGIKRFPFVLNKTDDLRLGDPLTIVFEKQNAPQVKGHSGVKVFAFFGTNLPENAENQTVKELDAYDEDAGGSDAPEEDDDLVVEPLPEGQPTEPPVLD